MTKNAEKIEVEIADKKRAEGKIDKLEAIENKSEKQLEELEKYKKILEQTKANVEALTLLKDKEIPEEKLKQESKSKYFKCTEKASIVGDTVGDPMKDTSGPSLNILIKLSSIISVIFGGLFMQTSYLIQ